MPTLLQARQTLDAALATQRKRPSASTFRAAQVAHEDYIAALLAAGQTEQAADALKAKVVHRTKYEKVTTETPDKEEQAADSPAPSGMPDSGVPVTVDSESPSARGEDEKPKPEERGSKRGKMKRAEDEGDEEKALAGAFVAADKAYKSSARSAGFDAYAVRGPSALLVAAQKALGTSGIAETFGALAELPKRLAAADVEAKIEEARQHDEVAAIVAKAKAEGRTQGSEHRAELRRIGAQYGAAHLRGIVKMLPAKRTAAQGYRQPPDGHNGNAGPAAEVDMSAADIAKLNARITSGMSAEERKVFDEEVAALAAKRVRAPAV